MPTNDYAAPTIHPSSASTAYHSIAESSVSYQTYEEPGFVLGKDVVTFLC